ncbi:hypothetical protein [Variovorax sp. E3]|uniref:hypothetical protein n=1 Tax=Variovorax sp. E3 TaxID=1914993 RepID=UPI0027DC7626|nr:hypothetical protein [Variovorax sp. E3]
MRFTSTGTGPFAFLATAVLAAVGFSFFAAWAPGSKNAVAQNATAMNLSAGRNRWLETRRRRASGINKSPAATNEDRSVSKSKKGTQYQLLASSSSIEYQGTPENLTLCRNSLSLAL